MDRSLSGKTWMVMWAADKPNPVLLTITLEIPHCLVTATPAILLEYIFWYRLL